MCESYERPSVTPSEPPIMRGLRTEIRQSGGDAKPRNVRGRCQKTTTRRPTNCGEYRQAAVAKKEAPTGDRG